MDLADDNDPDSNIDSPGDSTIHNIHRFMIYSTIDVLTALGVLYLFYELEMRYSKKNGASSSSKGGRNGQSSKSEPKMIDFRMNHGTKHLREILHHSGNTEDDISNVSVNDRRLFTGAAEKSANVSELLSPVSASHDS